MPELVAIAYEDETAADRAVVELRRCAAEVPIDREASAALVCGRDGHCQLTITAQADASDHWSEMWGVLLESLLGAGPIEIERYFRNELMARLWPGASMLLLVVPADRKQRALAAVSQFGGQPLSYRLADDLRGGGATPRR
jgi:uncharacterized membrane protein